MTIGERIKARRQELKMSQREMASRLGYTDHTTLTRIEAGKIDLPQSRLMKIAEVLGVAPGYLLGLVSEDESKKNDQLVTLIAKMRKDPKFFNIVSKLSELPDEQYDSLTTIISALSNK